MAMGLQAGWVGNKLNYFTHTQTFRDYCFFKQHPCNTLGMKKHKQLDVSFSNRSLIKFSSALSLTATKALRATPALFEWFFGWATSPERQTDNSMFFAMQASNKQSALYNGKRCQKRSLFHSGFHSDACLSPIYLSLWVLFEGGCLSWWFDLSPRSSHGGLLSHMVAFFHSYLRILMW